MFVFIFYMFQANRLGGHNVTLVYVPDLFISLLPAAQEHDETCGCVAVIAATRVNKWLDE